MKFIIGFVTAILLLKKRLFQSSSTCRLRHVAGAFEMPKPFLYRSDTPASVRGVLINAIVFQNHPKGRVVREFGKLNKIKMCLKAAVE